jgi:hypothetical protein
MSTYRLSEDVSAIELGPDPTYAISGSCELHLLLSPSWQIYNDYLSHRAASCVFILIEELRISTRVQRVDRKVLPCKVLLRQIRLNWVIEDSKRCDYHQTSVSIPKNRDIFKWGHCCHFSILLFDLSWCSNWKCLLRSTLRRQIKWT